MSDRPLTLFDLSPGKVLGGRFQIQRPLRQGGMSATFVVHDAEAGAERELQVFPAALFDAHEQAEEFAALLARWEGLDSAAVVPVREVSVRGDGSLLLVTDVPPGESLRDWLTANGRMALEDVRALGLRLLGGLREVHGAGLVHGDIKPHAVHLDGRPEEAVLVDGGITSGLWQAKHLGDRTALIGTPFYAPIEQFSGESPDVQSDLYNLATVLYELCVGVVPWPGASFLEIFQGKLEKSPPRMASRCREVEVPPELEAAIAGGLMADRRDRYATAEQFEAALAAVPALD